MHPINPFLASNDDLHGNMDEEDRKVWAHFMGDHGGEIDAAGLEDLNLLAALYFRLTGLMFDSDLGVTNGWARCTFCHPDQATMPALRDPAS